MPSHVPGVEPHILEPIKTWRNKGEFAEVAGRLVQMFRDNFKRFETHADERVRAAGPRPCIKLALIADRDRRSDEGSVLV